MKFFLPCPACAAPLTPWSSSADTTGGQFLATTRCSSTSNSSSGLLGEKPGLLATPSLQQNGSVYLGRFFVFKLIRCGKGYASTNLLYAAWMSSSLMRLPSASVGAGAICIDSLTAVKFRRLEYQGVGVPSITGEKNESHVLSSVSFSNKFLP